MMEQYKINLIVYRRYDIDPYPWTIDLGFITHVEQLGYSLRHTRSSRGYNLRDIQRPASNQENTHEQMEVIQEQTVQSPHAASTSEEPLDMSVKSTYAPSTSQLPLDMSVRNQVSVTRHDDSCVEASIVANINHNIIDSSLQQDTSPDVNPKTTDSHESMEVDNSEVQQTEIAIASTGDIPSSNLKNIDDGQDGVNMSVDNNNSTVTDVAPCPNEDSLDSKEQGNEGDDTLSIVSNKGTENDGDVQNNELENIEAPNSVEGETLSVSKEHIELSEFEETVDYGEDSSDDSSSGSSPHDSPQNKPPIVVKPKTNWSLRPPLIMRSQSRDKNPSRKSNPLPKNKPKRVQPKRAKKATVLYMPDSSDGSQSESSHSDKNDEDFIPDGVKG